MGVLLSVPLHADAEAGHLRAQRERLRIRSSRNSALLCTPLQQRPNRAAWLWLPSRC